MRSGIVLALRIYSQAITAKEMAKKADKTFEELVPPEYRK